MTTDGESKWATLDGVVRCGSSSGCVSCAWWLRYHQRRELEALVALWTAQGGTLALVTLTIRHWAALSLDDSVKGVRSAWRGLTRGNPWTKILSRLGAAHVLRTLDVTHGEGGWHVHVHAVVFLRPGAAPSQDVVQQVFARWSKQVEKQKLLGARCVPMPEGLDWREVESASYLAKMEVADAAPGAPSRSPWQIAAGAAEGVAEDIALWKEWVMAMKGTPSLPPPRHLAPVFAAIRAEHARERAADREARAMPVPDVASTDPEDSDGVTPDASPLDAAAASTDDAARYQEPDAQRRPITKQRIATFPAPVWDRLVRIRGAVADLLHRAVHGGLTSVAEGTAAHLFGITADGVPDPRAVAWVLRLITPGSPASSHDAMSRLEGGLLVGERAR